MFQFASVSQLILLFIYPFEAIFFAIITKNCFIDKMPARKAVALLLISPAAAHWITFFICHLLVPELDNTHDYLMYSGINTLLLAVTQLLFLLCYIKITHARNRSIALFIYLCCAVLVPGIDTTLSIDFSIIPLIVSTALMVSFDFLTVRPLSENSKEEQLTNPQTLYHTPDHRIHLQNDRSFPRYVQYQRRTECNRDRTQADSADQSSRRGNRRGL